MSVDNYKMPQVEILTPVLASRDPDMSNPKDVVPGFVVERGARSISIFCFQFDGYGRFRDCWHKTDPRCLKMRKQIIEVPDRAVWDFATGEKERQLFISALRDAAVRMNALEERMSGLEETVVAHAKQIASNNSPKKGGKRGVAA